jgi:S-adenosylmethionine:tRNA ribosyltransferase-isomerase
VFIYDLPDDRIAQRPVYPPESAKMLFFSKKSDSISDLFYSDIPSLVKNGILKENDIFIFNNSKVIPARLFGNISNSTSQVELLLLKRIENKKWVCLGKPMKKFKSGTQIEINSTDHRSVIGTVIERTGLKEVVIEFNCRDEELFSVGNMPIPPYIRGGKSDDQDKKDYQSIFANSNGSVAAPTASLHFSNNLINEMKNAGLTIKEVTLHVGAASFLPLWTEEDEVDGKISEIQSPGIELFKYDLELFEYLLAQKQNGARIVPVGTTVVRALESIAKIKSKNDLNIQNGELVETDLFITPGFDFKVCSGLITNFHQPRTTHLMLVSAFCSVEKLQELYKHALNKDYRFLSYGDGMFII